jgi:non-heme chloroperoxidase
MPAGDLAKQFRIVTCDLRGHGSSDKPPIPWYYREGALWARELRAVTQGAELKRPLLVGWLVGGVVIKARKPPRYNRADRNS